MAWHPLWETLLLALVFPGYFAWLVEPREHESVVMLDWVGALMEQQGAPTYVGLLVRLLFIATGRRRSSR